MAKITVSHPVPVPRPATRILMDLSVNEAKLLEDSLYLAFKGSTGISFDLWVGIREALREISK